MSALRVILLLVGLLSASIGAAQAPEDRAEYRALRHLLAGAPARKAQTGDLRGTPYLMVSGGERIPDPGAIIPHGVTPAEPPGFDAVHVTVYGPGAAPWEARGADQTSIGTPQAGAAPGGGMLFVRYQAYVPMPERRTPYSDVGNPARVSWLWSYREHRLILTQTFRADVSESDAMAAIRPLAELVHRGFVEDGLADGGGAAAAAPGRYRATIRIPPLTPGEVLSPSVDVLDENGQPPTSSIYVSWFINGVNAPSVVWDGRETRVEVQVNVANQALVEAVLIPAYQSGAPSAATPTAPTLTLPTDVLPTGPVPGLGGVGPLPGPGSLGQALVGTLLPPLLITLGQLLAGIRGGGRVPPLPTVPQAAPAAAPAVGPPKLPAASGIDPAWTQRIDRLAQVAKHDRNPQLAAAVQAIRGQLAGPRDPKAWAAAQQQLKDALGQLDQHLPKPNGVGWDAAAAVVGGVRDTAVQAGGAIRDAGGAFAAFPGQVWQGLKGLGNGLLNPGNFVAGVNGLAKDWISKHLKTEGQAFVQGLKDGKLGDALGALGQGLVKAAGSALGAAWQSVGKSILPVDELKSFTDPHASREEKLWAVPAAAVKIAGILVGLQKPTSQPSTAWGQAIKGAGDALENRGLVAAGQQASQKIGQLEAQVASLEAAAATRPDATINQLLDRTRKALEQAKNAQQATQKALEVQQQAQQILPGRPPVQNFQQAQQVLKENPTLAATIDDAIRADQGGNTLYDVRSQGLMSKETHQLMTARKLELQQQAVNAATKRAIEEEVKALQAAGQPIPKRFHTFNATQGSRTNLSGSNIQADLDQTVIGLKNVGRDRMETLIQQECEKLGMTQQQLDINIYRPKQGLMDAAGSAPNAQVTLENIGQTTGTSGHHMVHVDKSGNVHVGNHVGSLQGREGVLAGKTTATRPPGVSDAAWQESMWEGHQGAPVQIPRDQWPGVRATQVEGFQHALEKGDLNQMVKYANRGRAVGLPMEGDLAEVIRTAAGQKDPLVAKQTLAAAGIHSPADLAAKLGLGPHR